MDYKINKKTYFIDLGLIEYKQAWEYQEELFNEIINIKISNRSLPEGEHSITSNYLIFCEHHHVYTLGKSGQQENLLISDEELKAKQASFFHIDRGGDITYHGPGQIVGYPIVDLDNFFTDIHKYLRFLEEAIILTLKEYGLEGGRIKGMTGVWLDIDNPKKARKICAIGVRSSRWVTMHGFAFNVNSNLDYFSNIVPCGITDKTVTSLAKELGKEQDINEVKEKLKKNLTTLFEFELLDRKETA